MEKFVVDDSFTNETGEYDLTLIVDGHKIRVWKLILCVASPVFRAMLQSEFKERDQAEVELPGKKHKAFVEFLRCLYPDRLEHVTSDSVYRILPLAVEYQVKILEGRCRLLLIELVKAMHLNDAVEIYRHLQLADLYKLEDLRKLCISAASDFRLDEMKKGASQYPIPAEILIEIHHLARRKQELNVKDDNYLLNDRIVKQNAKYESFIVSVTKVTVFSDNSSKLRAARLCYRYFPDSADRLQNVIKCLRDMMVDDNIREEYDLLPESRDNKTTFGLYLKFKNEIYS